MTTTMILSKFVRMTDLPLGSAVITASLLAPGYTIPAVLANQFAEAVEELHIGALMYLALILFVITLVVNSIAILLVQFINRKRNIA